MITNREALRLRRRMHQRIREVVAERRMARQGAPVRTDGLDQAGGGGEPQSNPADTSLVGG